MTQEKRHGTQSSENQGTTRRNAMGRIAVGALGAACCGTWSASASRAAAQASGGNNREFIFFSKPFQKMSFAELGEYAAEAGYTGLEFPVRPGGHVEPEAVEDELPKAVEALAKCGITIPLIATGINEVSDAQYTDRVLQTAAKLGIPRFRMAYYRYDLKQPIAAQLRPFAAKMNDLVAAAAEFGIKPLYQNHSGLGYVGAPLWDVYSMIRRHSPEEIGLAFDVGHAIVEGTKGWPLNFALIQDYLDVAYVKDPIWSVDAGKFGWSPLGTGLIPAKYWKMLADRGFAGPMSIHVEYWEVKDPAHQDEFLKAFPADLATLKRLVADAD